MFDDRRFTDIAKKYAELWVKDTYAEKGTLLAFDRKDTWSIKYNIIWDKLLNLGLFPKEVYKKKLKHIRQRCVDMVYRWIAEAIMQKRIGRRGQR